MTFKRLLDGANVHPKDWEGDGEIESITLDSRNVGPGALFVAMPGMTRESESFIPAASQAGATAALVHTPEGYAQSCALGLAVGLVEPSEFADSVWKLCDVFYDHPTRAMKVVGVTGTNGKTTTAWLVRDLLAALGESSGYLGTLGFQLPGIERELSNTTPFAVELYPMLAEARDAGVDTLAIEISSHALAQHRADGLELDVAVFTNLTQDHLDFHETMESYAAAKHRLFTDFPRFSEKPMVGVFNADDPVGAKWAKDYGGKAITYGFDSAADLRGKVVTVTVDRIELEMTFGKTVKASAPLGGTYNTRNILCAAATLLALGFDLESIRKALAQVRPVPGRLESVSNDKGIGVIVDYAHTPDAIEKLLDSIRPLTEGRILTVFGCGGDRETTKRPLMARAASTRSDVTILTSDNPRTEDPLEILNEVKAGIAPGTAYSCIPDREEAVKEAICMAQPGDVVVIAGKGHENYQIIGRTKIPMDDRELAREALQGR